MNYNTNDYLIAIATELSAKNDMLKAKQLLTGKETDVMLDIAEGKYKAKNAEERKAIIETESASIIKYLNECEEDHRNAQKQLREQEHLFDLYKLDAKNSVVDKELEIAKLNHKTSVNNLEAAKLNNGK